MRAVEHSGTNKSWKALPFLGLKKQRWVVVLLDSVEKSEHFRRKRSLATAKPWPGRKGVEEEEVESIP